MRDFNSDVLDFRVAESDKDVETLITSIKKETSNSKRRYYALDLETKPIDSKRPGGALIHTNALIRLVQIFSISWSMPYVIDVDKISRECLISFFTLLEEIHYKNVVLIAHNASYEYIIIRQVLGIRLNNIKDTYTALCTLNVSHGWKEGLKRGLSLADMARDLFDIRLDKTLQNSRWIGKRLSDKQLIYSAIDVSAPKGNINPFTNKPLRSILIEAYRLIEYICCNKLKEQWAFDLDQRCVPVMAEMKFTGWSINDPLKNVLLETVREYKEDSLKELCKGLKIPVKYDPFKDEYIVPSWITTNFNNPKKLVSILNDLLKNIDKSLMISNSESKILLDLLKRIEDVYENSSKELESIEEDIEGNRFNDLNDEPLYNNDEENSEEYEEKAYELILEKREENKNIEEKKVLVENIVNYKRYSKYYEFVKKYLDEIDPITNRLHLSIKSVGTSTGRCASSDSLTKINAQNIPNRKIVIECPPEMLSGIDSKHSKKYKVYVTPRNLFTAPRGYTHGSFDYISQELAVVAYASGENKMIDTFKQRRDKPTIYNPKTDTQVPNPDADLHTRAATYIYPALLNIPKYELDNVVRTPDKNGIKARDTGKIMNFSIIYGKTPAAFAVDFNVSIEEAKKMVENYLNGFPNLNIWLKTNTEVSKITKVVRTMTNRVISIWEDNAKGIGNSGSQGRKGINSGVQGPSADMIKKACIYIQTRVPEVKLLSVVHDECNCQLPGECRIKDIQVDKKGFMKPIYEVSEETLEASDKVIKCMEDAELDILSMTGYDKEEIVTGVSATLAPYWQH